ncbi:MAG: histidine kinase dimerization/phospho-acceptor domain-containing protein, partial [Kofleriaceae bacterium]
MTATDVTEIRRLIRELDWSQTSLGAPEHWPQSLKTAFGMCLASRFPFIIFWGDDLTVIYNDAYTPIFMNKHPGAFGSPGLSLRAWGEPVTRAAIEPMLRGVMAGAEATWSEDQRLILERSGFPEETYFTWSYSPIPAEGGRVGGVLTTVTEVTQKVLSERRLRVLRELSAHAAEAKTTDQACREAIQVLRGDPHDLPFALLYVLEGTIEGDEATLHGAVGIPPDHPAAPAQISLGEGSPWPLHRAQQVAVEVDLAESSLLGAVPADPWPEPARRAVVLPLLCAGEARPYGFLIAGTSPRLAVGPPYHDFLQLVAGHIATAIANAKTSQAERQRAEKLAELDRAKTTFFSNVSHEFRTPLTLMLGPLEDVLPHIAEPQRAELERVHRNGKRLLKLVNTLLDFSRVEAGRVDAGYEPVDLAVLTADLASSFRSLTERAGLSLVVECAALPEPIWVDPDMWEKIVLNL